LKDSLKKASYIFKKGNKTRAVANIGKVKKANLIDLVLKFEHAVGMKDELKRF